MSDLVNLIHNPTCPHCGYVFDDDETWHTTHSKSGVVYTLDGVTSSLNCPTCKEDFEVVCLHLVSFENID